mmetsp:Transcript_21398/g.47420  ORF Transcript_21398/g.47420 Transcript_21398/m.47420 type:complete len:283 (-) Transcript_21398:72-920(-)
MDAQNAERSKLVQRQNKQRQEMEKKVKKLKGAMKDAAQRELEELESQLEAELAAFNKGGSKGEADSAKAASKAAAEESKKDSAADMSKNFKQRNWNGLSKKELEEECVERGLGKKGSKEDLITKLVLFHQDLASKRAQEAPAESSDSRRPESGAKAKGAEDDSEDSDDEDEDDEESDDDEEEDEEDEDELEVVDPEEAERQGKREKAVQKAIRLILSRKCPEGFPLSEFAEKLEMVGVQNFAPEKLGYRSMEKFVRGQPEALLRYSRKAQMIRPPRKRKEAD